MKRFFIVVTVLFSLAVVAVGAAVLTVPQLKWRGQLLMMKAQGRIFELSWGELVSMLRPGSGYYLEGLIVTGNPYGTIRNALTADSDIAAGEAIYREQCSNCHGGDGVGGVGPALNVANASKGDTDWWLFRTITRGVDGTAMTAQAVTDRQAWQTVAYLRSIRLSDEASLAGQALPETVPVSFERILEGREAPDDWLTYSGDYDGKRYSVLDEIDRTNAGSLNLKWMYQTAGVDAYLETSPIVNDGVMYATVSPGSVLALDAATGERLWQYDRPTPERLSLCCGTVNRGVAILGDTVYWATLDAHLVAIDARTGKRRWETEVADNRQGYSITSAPLAVKDLVLIGVSGGEFGIRGHLDAYDAETGDRVWRFYTIPGPGEPGNETWSGDSWKRGGAGAWLTGSYDAQRDLIYWGTGNPGPLYNGDGRLGDNLYANSVVALETDTGKMRWYFQFTPHDLHDWAANQIPVLVDADWRGQKRALLVTANRNGFFYVLDRDTGEFLAADAYVKQNWALEIDDNGRPLVNPEAIPTPEGTVTWPSPHGGTNWQSPAYSPRTGLFYVAALDGGRVVYKQADTPQHTVGEFYLGSMHQLMAGDEQMVASLKAIDPQTGQVAWQYDNPPRRSMWRTGGVLATAGDIVFAGDYTSLYALDARDGTELWRLNVGGYINAAPVTYRADGRQQITIAAGNTIMTFGLPDRFGVVADSE